jgi:lipase
MDPVFHQVKLNGAELAYYERGQPRADAPSLLFVHATGFHARLWDYQAEAFPDLHSVAVDLRGHGRSEKVAADSWRTFADDLVALLDSLQLTRVIGISHSMGAHAMADAAARCDRFSRLILLDPTILEPSAYQSDNDFRAHFPGGKHPASKRRNQFESVDDMVARLAPKSSFPLMDERIFRDYCQWGLLPAAGGGFVLACPPDIEAEVYMTSRSNSDIYQSIAGVEIPVLIVRAQSPAPGSFMDFSSSPTWPGLVDVFPNAVEQHWSDCSHFIPMQRPQAVVELIREQVARWGEA